MIKLPKIVLKSRGPIIAVDAIIIDSKKKILLTKRNIPPFENYWVLSGGHVKYGERVEKALIREVKEETGYRVQIERILGIYSNPRRDPRYHIIAVTYITKIISGKSKLNREVGEIKFFSKSKLPKKIGFDHRKMIKDYFENAKK